MVKAVAAVPIANAFIKPFILVLSVLIEQHLYAVIEQDPCKPARQLSQLTRHAASVFPCTLYPASPRSPPTVPVTKPYHTEPLGQKT
jgi:hypothetical protein